MRDLEAILRVFAQQVEQELNGHIEALIVYGSVARGDATLESDIDVLVLLKRADAELVRRVERIRDGVVFEYGQAITLDFETYESLRRLVEEGNLFARNVLEEGKALWDHKGYFRELRALSATA